ncbi:hypothetical protein FHR84_000224 [Actinopolyspora biskrensis]|uniref:FtsX-like permease family protein n=1 Tax=Actinopolyspora biskrensis TaxID=1470178 RepID=A0A852YS19_9ACTN|nr:hypothetical protein [Actinopolyspora biskrensis]NYH76910.1 hypothetical protein [Actinopolyspora biskrensis]
MGGGAGSAGSPRELINRGTLAVVLVFTFLLSTITGVSSGMRAATERDVLRADGADRIVVSSLPSMTTRGNLNARKLNLIEAVAGVEQVVPDYPSSLRAPEGDSALPEFSLAVRSWGSYVPPPLTEGTVQGPLPPDAIVVPARSQGTDFTRYLGRTIRMSYTVASPDPRKPPRDEGADEKSAAEQEAAEQEGDAQEEGAQEEEAPAGGAPDETAPSSPPSFSETIELRVAATYDPRWHADGSDTAYVAPRTAAMLAAADTGQTPEALHGGSGAERVGVLVDEASDVNSVAARLREMGIGAFPLVEREKNLIRTVELWRYVALFGVLISAALLGASGVRRLTLGELDGRGVLGRAAGIGLVAGVLATGLGVLAALALRAPMEAFLGLRIQWFTLVPGGVRTTVSVLAPALAAVAGAAIGSMRKPRTG